MIAEKLTDPKQLVALQDKRDFVLAVFIGRLL